MEKAAISLVDKPKRGDEPDCFNVEPYRKALIEFISGADMPITISLQGDWGTGKTSLMNDLRFALTEDSNSQYNNFYGIWINTWLHALKLNKEGTIISILSDIVEQLSACAGNNIFNTAFSIVKKYGKVFGDIVGKVVTGEPNVCPEMEDVETVSKLIEEIAKGIKSITGVNKRKGIIFFIDDLDRLEPVVAVQILELMKNIFDLESQFQKYWHFLLILHLIVP